MNAVESIIGAIKHRDPGERMAFVREIEKRAEGLPDDLMMTDEQVRDLARSGIDIGAHTVNHPILASVPDNVAREEILESKKSLEGLVQDDVLVFAYPNGRPELDYSAGHRAMVKEMGFKAAVSTHRGAGTPQSDPYQLPRFTPWDRQATRFAVRLLANYRNVDPLIGGRG
jgi:peptidoglycan/xylan/chitin deacetylase (PgdA/CDA1 family)